MTSNRHFRRRGFRTRAFTLLELLMAVALAGMLMIASISFLLSMSEIWGRGSDKRLFDQHVRGVTRFLEAFLQQAKLPEGATQSSDAAATQNNTGTPQTRGGGGGGGTPQTGGRPNAQATATPTAGNGRNSASSAEAQTKDRFTFGKPKGYDQEMVMFEVDQAPGICIWPERPLPRVECALQVTPDEGLVLLWISKLEEGYGTDRPRKTQISPFVKNVEFEYFDETTSAWERKPGPIVDPGNIMRMPQRFRLTFAYGAESHQVSISIPPAPGGPPLR